MLKFLLVMWIINPDGSSSYQDTGEAYRNPVVCDQRRVHQLLTVRVQHRAAFVCLPVREV